MTKRNTAFTLVELMTALAISLILLLGVIELFRSVGGTIQETQATLNMSSNLNAAATQLRSDLGKIEPKLVHQPHEMVINNTSYDEKDGYFEIIEGMNAPPQYIYSNGGTHILTEKIALNSDSETNAADLTVGDVDDVLAFTATSSADYPFRGRVNRTMTEATDAEIVYFVRGNTLYRRVLLIASKTGTPPEDYIQNDVSVYRDTSGNLQYNTLETLKDRRNRFAHCPKPISSAVFPFPIYGGSASYYLRFPTLEENVHPDWKSGGYVGYGLPAVSPVPSLTYTTPFLDFWDTGKRFPVDSSNTTFPLDTKSGSLNNYVSTPREPRAGEDIILKNVLSFDVKVWNPYWVPITGTTTAWAPPQYVDLGQDNCLEDEKGDRYALNTDGSVILASPSAVNRGYTGTFTGQQGFGFTTKGHYGGVSGAGSIKLLGLGIYDGTTPPTSSDTIYWTTPPMPCVFDSWTKDYETNANDYRPNVNTSGVSKNGPATLGDSTLWACPPPYEMDLTSIQITIRCFDPESKNIRQVRVVHHFP